MKKILGVLLLFVLSILSASTEAQQSGTFTASIIANPVTGNAPLTVQFSVNSTTPITAYSWDFNDDGTIDSTQANPSFTYNTPGNYVVKLNATDADGNVAVDTDAIIVKTTISISLSANPTSGTVPLNIQFNAIATGQEPLQYNWDFTGDNVIDDFTQNPKLVLNSAGTIVAKLTVIDATGNSATKNISITARLAQTNVDLVSFFPSSIETGEQTLTFIIKNEGNDVLTNLEGKLIGSGIQHVSSTKISALNPDDQDSISITAKFLQSGNISATLKIGEKSIPVKIVVGGGLTTSILQAELDTVRDLAQQYENQYVQKKADGYLVDAALDSIKTARGYIKTAQEALLEARLSAAKLNINLANEHLKDANDVLQNAPKQKLNIAAFFKENALAITATIAALAAVSGILMKLFGHARKFGEKLTTAMAAHKHKGKKGKKSKKSSSKKKVHKSEFHVEPPKEE